MAASGSIRRPVSSSAALEMRLEQLAACWLELRCCRGVILYPVTLLLEQRSRNARRPLREVVGRLRCKQCQGRPASVYLNETTSREHRHGPAGWSIELVPAADA